MRSVKAALLLAALCSSAAAAEDCVPIPSADYNAANQPSADYPAQAQLPPSLLNPKPTIELSREVVSRSGITRDVKLGSIALDPSRPDAGLGVGTPKDSAALPAVESRCKKRR
ncbi:MAG: hypothetical protein LW855_05070 [Alphaproteobacteria bacterium]|jgi:hypothetical protein|nr:hypothetical protein [Thalassospira sp.]MCE2965144.1 hypothetical protein [Alphaproteobacteria bacterium]